MEVKRTHVETKTIAYRESGGTGTSLLLVHGNSSSSESFAQQLGGSFGASHRVIAIDLPGHGDSDPAADPAGTYHLPGYAAVVAELARQLGLGEGIVVGWSLGGHIVLEAAKLLPRAAGFVIFGTPPLAIPPDLANAFLPHPAIGAAFVEDLTRDQMEGFAAACLAPDTGLDVAPLVAAMARADGRARATMAASIVAGDFDDEVEIVRNLDRPLAVLLGECEQLVNGGYLGVLDMPTLWRGRVQIIPGAGHTPQWETPERFNELLAAFAAEVIG
jgi:pimeloyl-ACP methyl ester carboxylesterase